MKYNKEKERRVSVAMCALVKQIVTTIGEFEETENLNPYSRSSFERIVSEAHSLLTYAGNEPTDRGTLSGMMYKALGDEG